MSSKETFWISDAIAEGSDATSWGPEANALGSNATSEGPDAIGLGSDAIFVGPDALALVSDAIFGVLDAPAIGWVSKDSNFRETLRKAFFCVFSPFKMPRTFSMQKSSIFWSLMAKILSHFFNLPSFSVMLFG